MSDRKRILTGIRPTGPLHLGHYAGALENWVRLQDEYECQFLIADYQVSDYADDIAHIRESVWEVALDWLAVGLDPERGRVSSSKASCRSTPSYTCHLSWFLPAGHALAQPDAEGGDGSARSWHGPRPESPCPSRSTTTRSCR